MGNPFYDDLDDAFRGVRVRVHTAEQTYEGWCGRWYYNEHGVVVYDAERDDGEEFGAITIHTSEMVERLASMALIREVRVADIAPSPYTQRAMADADHAKFVKLTRERGRRTRMVEAPAKEEWVRMLTERPPTHKDIADPDPSVDSLSGPQALLVERAVTELREIEEARYKLLVA